MTLLRKFRKTLIVARLRRTGRTLAKRYMTAIESIAGCASERRNIEYAELVCPSLINLRRRAQAHCVIIHRITTASL